ncbi:hypothetical protein [Micromonospora echinofusca]|uniref:HEAT repeat-containing protein n=1 Tax=Micromonospora echinofusca TaxID=47858 RepID=A0ABS3VV22_MICEH|nr:hypothetical protein [Micromonospora echinofusca]MBO4208373.1 hypothetical protein [Micromonospora echinofusca]
MSGLPSSDGSTADRKPGRLPGSGADSPDPAVPGADDPAPDQQSVTDGPGAQVGPRFDGPSGPEGDQGRESEDEYTDEEDEAELPAASDVLARLESLLGLPRIATGTVRVHGQNATGHGATAIGTLNLTTVRSGAGDGVWCQVLSARTVDDMMSAYAPAKTDERLEGHLSRSPLIRLSGRPGTGRFTSACTALARRYGSHRVGLLLAERLSDLVREDSQLDRDHGYVLMVDARQRDLDGMTLVGLAARVGRLASSLVVIGDFGDREIAGDLVEHQPAVPWEIFRAQLGHRLRGRCVAWCASCAGRCVEDYLDQECARQPSLRSYLDGSPQPAEIARLAEAVADTVPRGAELTGLLNRLLPQQLRHRARIILDPADEPGLADLGGTDYLRAFRLATGVLGGCPLTEIRWAAQQLLGPGIGMAGATGSLRQPDLDLLLGVQLREAVVAGETDRSAGVRTLRFSDSDTLLPASLLEVAWSDWGISERLLDWLAGLARTGSSQVRQAAGAAIGWSAGQSTGAVLDVLRALARERQAGVRQVAGVALVAMAMQPELRRPVQVLLDRWAEGTAYERDTVARAYALGLAQVWPETAVTQLRRVAQWRLQRWQNSVVRGLLEVYRGGHADLVVPALVDWVRSPDPEVRRHAARATRTLADQWAPAPRSHWPALLDLIRAGVVQRADVASLWAVALSLPETAYRSWRTLGYWLNQADGHPDVAEACLDLLRATIIDQPLRRRLAHQLRHVWRPVMPHNQLLFRLAPLTLED